MSPSRSKRTNPFALAVATVLLVAAIVAAWWVPIFARSTPKLGDFPFFYWYQLIMVPVIGILCWIAYLCVRPGRGAAAASEDAKSSGDDAGDGAEAAL